MKIRGTINNNAYELQGQILEENHKIIIRIYDTDALYNGSVLPLVEKFFDTQHDFNKWISEQTFIKKIELMPFKSVKIG